MVAGLCRLTKMVVGFYVDSLKWWLVYIDSLKWWPLVYVDALKWWHGLCRLTKRVAGLCRRIKMVAGLCRLTKRVAAGLYRLAKMGPLVYTH
jgi:hypothetical protein